MTGFTTTPPSDLAVQRRRTKALQILGFDIKGTFTEEQIRLQYSELVKAGHPDAAGTFSEEPPGQAQLNDLRHAKDFLLKQLGDADDG